jgi:hypothetical protein
MRSSTIRRTSVASLRGASGSIFVGSQPVAMTSERSPSPSISKPEALARPGGRVGTAGSRRTSSTKKPRSRGEQLSVRGRAGSVIAGRHPANRPVKRGPSALAPGAIRHSIARSVASRLRASEARPLASFATPELPERRASDAMAATAEHKSLDASDETRTVRAGPHRDGHGRWGDVRSGDLRCGAGTGPST